MIFIPQYRINVELELEHFRKNRSNIKHPISKLAEHRFQELAAYAEKKIAEAIEIEDEATNEQGPRSWRDPETPTRERYKARLDEARRIIYDVMYIEPIANAGWKQAVAQAKRRKDKPATDIYDTDRNTRIRAKHARLKATGSRDATTQVANDFGLSPSQVRRIVKTKRA